MTESQGTLYGVGVGPGDPKLITLKAMEVLSAAPVILAASSTKNEYSLALAAVREYVSPRAVIHLLPFPMTQNREELEEAWRRNAQLVKEILDQGQDAAYITLGDPLTYSTYGYLLRAVRALDPRVRVVTVPGVTAYHAAAARLNLPLALGQESLTIIPGINDEARIKDLSGGADTVVILKAYRNFHRIREALREMDLSDQAVLISRCGLEDEQVTWGLNNGCGDKPPYLSLLIVRKGGPA
ncbi:MAG: precorrin-2 C(20)-methyltransferase [Thermodesulfobacteriota bacterium]